MTFLNRCLWATTIGLTLSAMGLAQTTSSTVSPTGQTTTTTAGNTNTGNTGNTTSTQGGTATGGTTTDATFQAPTISAPSEGGISRGNVDTSNILGNYYANPFYQGRAGTTTGGSGTTATNIPGGFGNTLYTGTGAGRAGTTTGRATTTGRTGQTGRAGTANSAANSQITSNLQISYTATIKIPTTPITATQIQTEVRSALDATSMLTNGKGIEVTTADGGFVVLRGNVGDADEARFAEGLARVTPGVRQVKNELTFPKQ